MPKYVVIESHDPFDGDTSAAFFDLALALARADDDVAVLFVGNGVQAALAGQHSFWLAALAAAGVAVLVDGAALAARGFPASRLFPGVVAVSPGGDADDSLAGRKPLWIADAAVRRAA